MTASGAELQGPASKQAAAHLEAGLLGLQCRLLRLQTGLL
jgi:hypothetical protein